MYGQLQDDTHKYQCQRKIKPSSRNEERHNLRFADRARVLCDDAHIKEELKNIEDVFVANVMTER